MKTNLIILIVMALFIVFVIHNITKSDDFEVKVLRVADTTKFTPAEKESFSRLKDSCRIVEYTRDSSTSITKAPMRGVTGNESFPFRAYHHSATCALGLFTEEWIDKRQKR